MGSDSTDGYLLALESGGSKTECVILSPDDQVIAYGRGGPTSNLYISLEVIEESVRAAFSTALQQLNGIPPEFAVFAQSTMAPGEIVDKVVLANIQVDDMMHFGEHQVVFASDGHYALEPEGIAVVAGTGSSITGWHNGRIEHVGGLGPNIGDEGSAYDIGLRGVRAAIYSDDGRGPKTVLQENLLEHFGMTHIREILQAVHFNPTARPDIAAFSPMVTRAAAAGDAVAQEITLYAAEQLSLCVRVLARRLYQSEESFRVVLFGGVIKAGAVLIDPLRAAVVAEFPHAQVRAGQIGPAEALARLARHVQRREQAEGKKLLSKGRIRKRKNIRKKP